MAFGPGTDPFGFATTGIELQSVNGQPTGSEAQCENADGDVTASTVYAQQTTKTAEYAVRTGVTATLPDLGLNTATYTPTKLTLKRSNKDSLTITIEGSLSSLFVVAPDLYAINALVDAAYRTGGKGALAAGITVGTGAVIGGSIECSVQLPPPITDATGAIVDLVGVFGGRVEGTNEMQIATGTPTATAAASWALKADSGAESDDNKSYGTKTFTAFRNVLATP